MRAQRLIYNIFRSVTPADTLGLMAVEAVEEGHNHHHILAAVTVLLAAGNPEADILVVYVSISPLPLKRLCLCHTGILVVVGHNCLAEGVHNSVVVGEVRNAVVVKDSHAAAPGQGKTTW